MDWTIILKDGTRQNVDVDVRFSMLRGTKLIAPSPIAGDQVVLAQAFNEGECLLESPGGHQHRVAVEMIRGQWRVQGL